ncbi:hypothetical protein ACS5PJ_04895 [Pseudarthrobacter sp. YS3]|uniref:hypothetical protein n=1 Tax=Pseudarthrobacter sp. YS3 TaxID=3453718 RepID=UPI003EEE3A80
MTIVGITGHQSIPDVARQYILDGVREILSMQPTPLVGLSSLAAGADQLFAYEVLAAGGDLHAVIPSKHYEETFSEVDRSCYFKLRNRATEIKILDYEAPSEEAFDAAGRTITERCDIMIAIWDGKAARGQGGTGDAVEHARSNGKPVHIIWPAGVTRD